MSKHHLQSRLAAAKAELEAAKIAAAHFAERSRYYRDLAAEQPQHQQWRYTNTSVQFRGQADGMEREVGQLMELVADLERQLANNAVDLSAESIEGMDLTLTAVLL